jgi:hypothetical protein
LPFYLFLKTLSAVSKVKETNVESRKLYGTKIFSVLHIEVWGPLAHVEKHDYVFCTEINCDKKISMRMPKGSHVDCMGKVSKA